MASIVSYIKEMLYQYLQNLISRFKIVLPFRMCHRTRTYMLLYPIPDSLLLGKSSNLIHHVQIFEQLSSTFLPTIHNNDCVLGRNIDPINKYIVPNYRGIRFRFGFATLFLLCIAMLVNRLGHSRSQVRFMFLPRSNP